MNAPDRTVAEARHVGAAIPRSEDERFLTGTARFTDDVRMGRMLHAAILRSTHSNARIIDIDTTAATAMPGVALVVTAADFAGTLPVIPIRLAPLPGLERFLQHPIAAERVRFVGDPIAVVIAESRYLAEDALDLIAVTYEPLDPVTTMTQALAGQALVHEDVGTNVGSRYEVSRGDPTRAFAMAEYTRKERFRIHRHTAAPLETRGLVAEYDGTLLRVLGQTKVPFFNRRILAKMIGLAESAIEFIETDIGGGFGVRGEFYPEDFLIPWVAMRLRRPVKWIEDRREHLLATNHSREAECELEIAAMRDGTILGVRATVIADLGAYARTNGGVAIARTAQYIPGPYRIPNYSCEVIALFSNKTPVGTFRGPGHYEANFYRERMLDLMASDLGLDRIALRVKNLISASEIPYDIGKLVPYESASAFDGGDFHSAFRQALEASQFASLPRDGVVINGRHHGVGVACFIESTGAGPSEHARIVACSDGCYEIYSGAATMGQGHETVFAQIAADELGTTPSAFRVFHGSTIYVDEGWGTFHSRAVVVGGSAVKIAAETMRKKLVQLASTRSGIDPDRLTLVAGAVIRSDNGDTVLDVASTAKEATNGDVTARDATDIKARFDINLRTFAYGTHVAHVAVDPETAAVEVLDYVALGDIGRVVNPLLAKGQVVGGASQGIGATFLDEILYDESGQLITGTFADYLVGTSAEAPPVTPILLEEAPSASNPLGAKGVGEGGMVATGAAIGNAVANALLPLGVKLTALPLSLEKLSASIRAARTSV